MPVSATSCSRDRSCGSASSPTATITSPPTSMSSSRPRAGRQPRSSSPTSGSSHCCWTSSPATAQTTPDPYIRSTGRPHGRPAPHPARRRSSRVGRLERPRPRDRDRNAPEQADQNPQPGRPAVAHGTPRRPKRRCRRPHTPLPQPLHRDQRHATRSRRAQDRPRDRGNRRLRARTLTRPRRTRSSTVTLQHQPQQIRAHRTQSRISPQHRTRDRMARDPNEPPRPSTLPPPQSLPARRIHEKFLPKRPLARRTPARLPSTMAPPRPPTPHLDSRPGDKHAKPARRHRRTTQ